MVELTFGIAPDLENPRAETAGAPANGSELLRIAALLIHDIHLVENLGRLVQAYAVLSLDLAALFAVESEARCNITVIPTIE